MNTTWYSFPAYLLSRISQLILTSIRMFIVVELVFMMTVVRICPAQLNIINPIMRYISLGWRRRSLLGALDRGLRTILTTLLVLQHVDVSESVRSALIRSTTMFFGMRL